jgi:glyoxylase-like metal-dependent hydrolase (beta-lactamase superfamily II)
VNLTRLFAGLALCAAASLAAEPAKLHVQVFTSTPEGYSVNSTLVYGDKDAVLIDTQFLLSEAHKLAAMILESKKNLTTVYITHPHPDHFFGLAVIHQAFPNAKIVALPATANAIKTAWPARYKFWHPTYGDNLPSTPPVIPEPLEGNALMLEGNELQVVGGLIGDSGNNPNNSYVWIPSIKTVVAGDIVFSGVYFSVPKTPEPWIKTLDQIAALKPEMVVPGHQIPGAKQDLSAITFMKKYMKEFTKAEASSKNAAELKSKMERRFPNMGLMTLLDSSSKAAFPAGK